MPIFLSPECLQQPTDLMAVLELFRMAEIRAVRLDASVAYPRETPKALEGMELWLHHGRSASWINLAAGDDDFRKRSVNRIEAMLEFALRCGARIISIPAGYALEETWDPQQQSRMISRHRAADQLKRSIDHLARIAEDRSLVLALDNSSLEVSPMLLADPSETAELLADLQIPFLGINLDLQNMEAAGKRLGFTAETYLAQLGSRLLSLQLHPDDEALSPSGNPLQPEWFALPMAPLVQGLDFARLLELNERWIHLSTRPTMGPQPAL